MGGVVYEAEDSHRSRRVAVKVLPPPATESEERIRRFHREARAASLLNHPNIVSIYDAGFEQGSYYIALEYVEGKTLRAVIAAESRGRQPQARHQLRGRKATAPRLPTGNITIYDNGAFSYKVAGVAHSHNAHYPGSTKLRRS
jgi:serine/threonine protein kinase